MIAATLPPSERETYQTHIPWRSKAVLLTLPPGSTCPGAAGFGRRVRRDEHDRHQRDNGYKQRQGAALPARRETHVCSNTVVAALLRAPL